MKIFKAIKDGFIRSSGSWKGILIVWFVTLVLVSIVSLPMRASLQNSLNGSMVTEKLHNGINLDVFEDLGSGLSNLVSYFSKGLFMIILAGLLINSFFSGGLFHSLKADHGKFSANDFFRASSKNFWSFLSISIIMSLTIMILVIIIVIIPISIMMHQKGNSDYIVFGTGVLMASFFLFVLVIVLLAADYSRAWQVIQTKNAPFRAIGFGFSQTFTTFFSSYPLMLILFILQGLYTWMVLSILGGIKSGTSGGIVLLFLFSQILFIIRLFLKTSRYGSITRMMEINATV